MSSAPASSTPAVSAALGHGLWGLTLLAGPGLWGLAWALSVGVLNGGYACLACATAAFMQVGGWVGT
jgi:hypothetical protein